MNPRSLPIAIVAAALTVGSIHAQQPDALVRARTLYQSAAYADAVRVLDGADTVEALEYLALCHLALGHESDAERAVGDIVRRDPSFTPNAADVPPRFVALFASIRRAVLPEVIRQVIADGRAQLDADHYESAAESFARGVALTADPALDGEDVANLQFLAKSFLDLARENLATEPAAVVAAPATTPQPTPATPVAARPVESPPRDVDAKLTPAVAIRQDFPAWIADARTPDPAASGLVMVQIGKDGRVTGASIKTSLEPKYDALVLAATTRWQYHPATVNGQPVVSSKLLAYRVSEP
jgi:hypothetical protein